MHPWVFPSLRVLWVMFTGRSSPVWLGNQFSPLRFCLISATPVLSTNEGLNHVIVVMAISFYEHSVNFEKTEDGLFLVLGNLAFLCLGSGDMEGLTQNFVELEPTLTWGSGGSTWMDRVGVGFDKSKNSLIFIMFFETTFYGTGHWP